MLIRAKVDFGKPDIETLRNQGMTLVDMHFHTQYSDTYTKIDRTLKKAARLGIGLAITDHNEIKGSVEACKKRDEQLVIPGIEVTCYERCHILVYFVKVKELIDFYYNHVEQYKTRNPHTVTRLKTAELLKATHNYDCLKCAAHPFAGFTGIHKSIKRRHLHPQLLDKLDSIEVMNGLSLKKMNLKSLQWAENLNKAFTGGSDGHSLFALGKTLTYSEAKTVKTFLNNIREQRNYVIGKEIGLIAQMPSASRVIGKHLRYLRPTLQIRYEVSVKPSVRYHVPRLKKRLKKVRAISVERVRDIAERSRKRIDYRFERM